MQPETISEEYEIRVLVMCIRASCSNTPQSLAELLVVGLLRTTGTHVLVEWYSNQARKETLACSTNTDTDLTLLRSLEETHPSLPLAPLALVHARLTITSTFITLDLAQTCHDYDMVFRTTWHV